MPCNNCLDIAIVAVLIPVSLLSIHAYFSYFFASTLARLRAVVVPGVTTKPHSSLPIHFDALSVSSVATMVEVVLFAISVVLVVLATWAYLAAMLTDPGRVPSALRQSAPRAATLALRLTGGRSLNLCPMCATYKPLRAHHCSRCHRCVLKYDHHCPWLANCVGFFNYKLYLLTLLYVFLLTLLVFATLSVSFALHIWRVVQERDTATGLAQRLGWQRPGARAMAVAADTGPILVETGRMYSPMPSAARAHTDNPAVGRAKQEDDAGPRLVPLVTGPFEPQVVYGGRQKTAHGGGPPAVPAAAALPPSSSPPLYAMEAALTAASVLAGSLTPSGVTALAVPGKRAAHGVLGAPTVMEGGTRRLLDVFPDTAPRWPVLVCYGQCFVFLVLTGYLLGKHFRLARSNLTTLDLVILDRRREEAREQRHLRRAHRREHGRDRDRVAEEGTELHGDDGPPSSGSDSSGGVSLEDWENPFDAGVTVNLQQIFGDEGSEHYGAWRRWLLRLLPFAAYPFSSPELEYDPYQNSFHGVDGPSRPYASSEQSGVRSTSNCGSVPSGSSYSKPYRVTTVLPPPPVYLSSETSPLLLKRASATCFISPTGAKAAQRQQLHRQQQQQLQQQQQQRQHELTAESLRQHQERFSGYSAGIPAPISPTASTSVPLPQRVPYCPPPGQTYVSVPNYGTTKPSLSPTIAPSVPTVDVVTPLAAPHQRSSAAAVPAPGDLEPLGHPRFSGSGATSPQPPSGSSWGATGATTDPSATTKE